MTVYFLGQFIVKRWMNNEYIDKIKHYNSYYECGLINYILKKISKSIFIPLSLIFKFPLPLKIVLIFHYLNLAIN